MRRSSILALLSLLTLLMVVPGVAQDFEVFDLRVIAFDGYQPDVLENVRVSVDPGIELMGCERFVSLTPDQLRVEIADPELELDTGSDPFTILQLVPTPWAAADFYGGQPFTELSFTGVTDSFRVVTFVVDLPGEVCNGAIPLEWNDEALGGGLDLIGADFMVEWSGYLDSLGALTPDEFVSCADEGLTGALFGLCNAYCEAMQCGTADQQASDKACSAVARNYAKKSGGNAPPCVVD